MTFITSAVTIASLLFVGMLVLLEVGRRMALQRQERDPDASRAGFAAIEGAVFGLMGLMIAFTFSGASSRFENRRTLIVEEANAIGTAWLRLDLLPESARLDLRERFRGYLDSRLEVYRSVDDLELVRARLARSNTLQNEIWQAAVTACTDPSRPQATMLLLPALNQMIDITTSRWMATQFHQPTIIFGVLMALALASSLLAGYGLLGSSTRQRWVHMIGFAAITSIAIYVIFDLEYPRRGFIRVDAADQVLIDLRASME